MATTSTNWSRKIGGSKIRQFGTNAQIYDGSRHDTWILEVLYHDIIVSRYSSIEYLRSLVKEWP